MELSRTPVSRCFITPSPASLLHPGGSGDDLTRPSLSGTVDVLGSVTPTRVRPYLSRVYLVSLDSVAIDRWVLPSTHKRHYESLRSFRKSTTYLPPHVLSKELKPLIVLFLLSTRQYR